MNTLSFDCLNTFVNGSFSSLNNRRIESLKSQTLSRLLKTDSYLFRTTGIRGAGELINRTLDISIANSEDKIFESFLKDIAIYITSQTCGGHKSICSWS